MSLQELAEQTADKYRLPRGLVKAIIEQESSGNAWAVRFEPAFLRVYIEASPKVFGAVSVETERQLRATSFGPMQLMGQVARELGCTFPFLTQLCDPEHGIDFGCKKLAKLVAKYRDFNDVVASYNAGSPRHTPNGEYVNQAYVDSVMAKWKKYGP